MNITDKQVLLYFLKQYLQESSQRKQTHLDDFFSNFFLKEELIDIIKWKVKDHNQTSINLEKASHEELLSNVGGNTNILAFFIDKLVNNTIDYSPTEVFNTLSQLGRHTHYLASKPLNTWDEYDFSNYRSMLVKAGNLKLVHCVSHPSVRPKRFYESYQQAVVELQPKRFYDNEQQASSEKEEVNILNVYIPI